MVDVYILMSVLVVAVDVFLDHDQLGIMPPGQARPRAGAFPQRRLASDTAFPHASQTAPVPFDYPPAIRYATRVRAPNRR